MEAFYRPTIKITGMSRFDIKWNEKENIPVSGGERRYRNQNRQRKCTFFLFLFCFCRGALQTHCKSRVRIQREIKSESPVATCQLECIIHFCKATEFFL